MEEFRFVTLRDVPELKDAAAEWFHSKWGVPKEANGLFRELSPV